MVLVPEVIERFRNYLTSIDRLNYVQFFYIDVDDETRRERALQRDGTLDNFKKRLAQDRSQKYELFRKFADQTTELENNGDLEKFLAHATSTIINQVGVFT